MRKPSLFLLLLAAVAWPAAAQEYSLELNRPVRIVPIDTHVEFYTKITNLTDSELRYTIVRDEEIPEGWSSSICFESCLRPDVDSAGSMLEPGETDSFAVWIYAFTSEGAGDVTFRIFSGTGEAKREDLLTFSAITDSVKTLIVDPGREDDYESYVEELLPEGTLAGKWNSWMSRPSADDLAHFDNVYWLGGDGGGGLDSAGRAAIASYLDGGGKLMISGQEIAYGLCDDLSEHASPEGCQFLYQYLHAQYAGDDAGVTQLAGVAGDGLGDGLDFSIAGGTGADNQGSPDAVTAANGGAAFLDYSGTAYDGGIRYAAGDTRLVYLPFGFEGIADEASRQALFGRVKAFFEDETAPGLIVGIFQNPYLTSYLDLYVIGSEALDAAAMQVSMGGTVLAPELFDGARHVWRAAHRLAGTGTVAVSVAAADVAGNGTMYNASFGAAKIDARTGGVATSADGAARLEFGPGALREDAFIVVTGGAGEPPAKVGGPAGMIALDGGRGKAGGTYRFSPRGALPGGGAASLTFTWDAGRFAADETGRLAIRRLDGAAPLDTWVDADSRTATATVNELGAFSFGPAGGDATRIVDRSYARLDRNSPNPFNPATTIRFEIRSRQQVRLEIYDVAGRLVKTLVGGTFPPGEQTVAWRGVDEKGAPAPSGVYFARLVAGRNQQTRKITLIR